MVLVLFGLGIEYVGSIVVFGFDVKLIIDIFLLLLFGYDLQWLVVLLEGFGYQFWCENLNIQWMFFVKGMLFFGYGCIYYVYVMFLVQVDCYLLFCDWLCNYFDDVCFYVEIKYVLVCCYFIDCEVYICGKDEVVVRIFGWVLVVMWYLMIQSGLVRGECEMYVRELCEMLVVGVELMLGGFVDIVYFELLCSWVSKFQD